MTEREERPTGTSDVPGPAVSVADDAASARPQRPTGDLADMGERLRASRRERGLSLRDLGSRVGLSASLISQVETGRASPSVSSLYALAEELDVSVDDLLFGPRGDREDDRRAGTTTVATPGPTAPSGPVQRSTERKSIRLASGVIWERLTTTSEGDVEFLYVTYEVGGASSPADAFQRHPGHEWGVVISGRLHVTIGFDDYVLEAGDAISIDSSLPHRLWNDGDEPVHGIWFVIGRGHGDDHLSRIIERP